MVDRLRQWGVDTISEFGGDGIGDILEVLRHDSGGMRFITVRHEESAATARELRDPPGTLFYGP
jgi:thiamine pyrophosphate-dependent acetolactate synthase large subunit-like protein